MKRLINSKTQRDWVEQLSESLFYATTTLNHKIQDKSKYITIYFDNEGNILNEVLIETLINSTYPISNEFKNKFHIDENWRENCVCIDSESVCQLLFFMNREDILSIAKDILNCVCK